MQSELTGIVDAIPALVWTVRADADFVNQRWLDYTGLSPARIARSIATSSFGHI
jgi:PAS domain-containing protein